MTSISIDDFIVEYPNIENPNFIDTITHLQEFNELSLDNKKSTNVKSDAEKRFLKDQVFFKRFLAQETPYKEMLVFKGVGTGKTLTIAALKESYEYSISTGMKLNPALVLVKGPGMKENIEKELSRFFSTKYGKGKRKRLDSVANKIAKNYDIETWEKFLKHNPNPQSYNNRLIIIDESHNFIENEDAPTLIDSQYQKLKSFLSQVKGCLKIIMSGTPLRNRASDIADQMNLILPQDKQFVTGEEFMAKYYDNGIFKENMKEEFISHIVGRITYLRTPWVNKTFIGTTVPNYTKYLKLALSEMSPQQTVIVQATPEKSFREGISRASVISEAVTRDNFENIEMISGKFKLLIDAILANPDENVFIYSDHVNDSASGLGSISQLRTFLGFKGFVQIKNPNTIVSNGRYGYIDANDSTITKKILSEIIDKFNEPENKTGSFARIIIGGPKISEGYSFKNIRQIHILNPPWNMASLTQSIARGIRYQSLNAFRNKADQYVNIYLHASYYHGDKYLQNEPHDLANYRLIENKEKEISQIIRIIKENAVDCELNYNRNYNENDKDYSYECEYQKCQYTCNTTHEIDDEINPLNYNILYSDEDMKRNFAKLQDFFSDRYIATYSEIFEAIGGEEFILLKTLDNMIQKHIVIYNSYGFESYLKELNNVYFLSETYSNADVEQQFLNVKYVEFPIVRQKENQFDIIKDISFERDIEFIKTFCSTNNIETIFNNLTFHSKVLIIEFYFANAFLQNIYVPPIISKYFKHIYIARNFYDANRILFAHDQKVSFNNTHYHTLYYYEDIMFIRTKYKEFKIKKRNLTRSMYVTDIPESYTWFFINDKNIFKTEKHVPADYQEEFYRIPKLD